MNQLSRTLGGRVGHLINNPRFASLLVFLLVVANWLGGKFVDPALSLKPLVNDLGYSLLSWLAAKALMCAYDRLRNFAVGILATKRNSSVSAFAFEQLLAGSNAHCADARRAIPPV